MKLQYTLEEWEALEDKPEGFHEYAPEFGPEDVRGVTVMRHEGLEGFKSDDEVSSMKMLVLRYVGDDFGE